MTPWSVVVAASSTRPADTEQVEHAPGQAGLAAARIADDRRVGWNRIGSPGRMSPSSASIDAGGMRELGDERGPRVGDLPDVTAHEREGLADDGLHGGVRFLSARRRCRRRRPRRRRRRPRTGTAAARLGRRLSVSSAASRACRGSRSAFRRTRMPSSLPSRQAAACTVLQSIASISAAMASACAFGAAAGDVLVSRCGGGGGPADRRHRGDAQAFVDGVVRVVAEVRRLPAFGRNPDLKCQRRPREERRNALCGAGHPGHRACEEDEDPRLVVRHNTEHGSARQISGRSNFLSPGPRRGA